MDEHSNPDQGAGAGDEELLTAFIGPKNTGYFAGAFHAFARGKNVKWNWPAFFVTFPWMLYRKMWLYAFGYILALPILMWFVFAFSGVSYSSQFLLSFIIFYVVTPLFATRLYYGHARSKIGSVKLRTRSADEQRQAVARAGGTSVVGVVVGVLLLGVPGIAGIIIVGISIPAYNDYTSRAQVSEGLYLAGGAKAAVTEYYQDRGEWPADNNTAGLTSAREIQGKYVSGVRVENGQIFVSYGNDASSDIYGSTLNLSPADEGGYVRWTCGSHDIQVKNLPAACRP